jgi:DNA invertase Pin-like site-specific DNA recombinase
MAIIYVRQSKDRTGDGAAVDRQLAECKALAKRNGLTVNPEDVFIDNDVSASKGIRPGFEKLLAAVRDGRTNTVIVWATDRLYRRLIDLVSLVELAEKHKLTILTVRSGDLDLSTPAGRMLAGMLGSAARYEVEQKGARQVAANEQRAGKGIWQFTRRPYGYRRDEHGDAVQVPEEVAVISEGYERSLAGESGYSIVADWNARGVPAPGGKQWSVSQLRERLANPHYAGLVVHRGEVVGVGTHEPIISRDEFDQFVQQVKARAARRTFDNRTKYLLSGIARCGQCGGVLFARPEYRRTGGRRMTYQCTSCWGVSRILTLVDELVERTLVARLSMPDAASLLSPAVDVAPLLQEAATLRERRADLATLLAEGVLTKSDVRDQGERLNARIEEIEEAIGAAQSSGPLGAMVGADDVESRWAAASLTAKRELIRALAEVTVNRQLSTRVFDPDSVVIRWRSAQAA